MSSVKESAAAAAKSGIGASNKPVTSLIAMPSNKRLDFFKGFAPQISMVLPKNSDLNAARIVSLAVQLTADTKIAQCEPKSIVGAIMQSVILGFEPIPGLGLAAWIPYGSKLHFQIEYKGYLDLLHRTGLYDSIFSEVVKEGDEFEYSRGLHPDIKHVPGDDNFDSPLTHVYAVAYIKGSAMPTFKVLGRKEVYQIRDHYSQAYKAGKKDSPWFGVREQEMWKKTAILQLQKDLPKSVTIQKAVATDEKTVSLDDFDPTTHEIDFAKYEFITDTPEKAPESEHNGGKVEISAEKPPSTPPKQETEQQSADFGGTKEEAVAAAQDNLPEGMTPEDLGMKKCPACGEVYNPEDEEEVSHHISCMDGQGEPKEKPAKTTAVDKDLLLKDAMKHEDANRKVKYIKERFTEFKKEFEAAGVKNLGAFCERHKVSALSSYDITVGIYEEMLEDIKNIKK